ncbi:hypothetical protein F8388_016245 [Cannabis sativa]|uniref:Uncharacterized protein n=1 Tax=Cannabis sativa TaxID=3483 RepID=A0A7J6GGT5_CANSA|nr:hypothetical protein F8388_016245 [Cannabis sativa]
MHSSVAQHTLATWQSVHHATSSLELSSNHNATRTLQSPDDQESSLAGPTHTLFLTQPYVPKNHSVTRHQN